MAKIKRTSLSPDFVALVPEANSVNEHNDCSVKAIALVTGRPYAEVHAALAVGGRKPRSGTPRTVSTDTLGDLGFRVRRWSYSERIAMLESYPGMEAWCSRTGTPITAASITTHHWRRFPRSWAPHAHKRLIVVTARHMLAVIDGEVKDWSVNRSLRVEEIWEIEG